MHSFWSLKVQLARGFILLCHAQAIASVPLQQYQGLVQLLVHLDNDILVAIPCGYSVMSKENL